MNPNGSKRVAITQRLRLADNILARGMRSCNVGRGNLRSPPTNRPRICVSKLSPFDFHLVMAMHRLQHTALRNASVIAQDFGHQEVLLAILRLY